MDLKLLNTPDKNSCVKAKREAIHVFAVDWFVTFTESRFNIYLYLFIIPFKLACNESLVKFNTYR